MVLVRTLNFRGSKGQADLRTVFNSASTYSIIDSKLAGELANLEALPEPIDINTSSRGHFTRVENTVRLEFFLNGLRLSDEFIVVPELAEQAIIGVTTMQKWRIRLDFERDEIVTDPRAGRPIWV